MPICNRLPKSDPILLDSHVVLWLFEDSKKFRPGVDDAIEAARVDSKLYISAISFWELGLLHRKGRIRLTADYRDWVRKVTHHEGIEVLPLTLPILMGAYQLQGLGHHVDPSDLMIVASAIEHNAVLLTRDEALIEGGRTGRFKVYEI